MFLFIAWLTTYAAVNPDFTPKWQVGDSWEMVMRGMRIAELGVPEGDIEEPGGPLYIHFEVIDLKEISGEMCYVLEITYTNPLDERALLLNVRKDDFTLKQVLEISKEPDGTTHIDNFHDNGRDFVIFLDPFCIAIPCDFPNFPLANTNEERSIKHSTFGLMTQKVTFIDSYNLEIELSTENNKGLLKTTQIWERGKPWWSSIKRTFTYEDYSTGETKTGVEYNGVLEGTDLTPPDLSIGVNPTTLWPPDHKMAEITPAITVTDDYDRFPEVKVYSVESNEPDDAPGKGDGNTTGDIKITEDGRIYLRAERDGNGNGRIYTITYSATDFSGNTSTASAIVTVPHDKEKKK